MKKILILLFLVSNFSFACLNGHNLKLKNGSYLYMDHGLGVASGHELMYGNLNNFLKEFDSIYKKTKDIDYLSDKGVILIFQKKYNEAIKLYSEIEKSHPNRYSTASNLGTAYELIGDNVNALKWIEKSIKIDPKSHKNSEWIHVNILKAKIDNTLINSDFLIKLNFGNEVDLKVSNDRIKLYDLRQALFYQVNERATFIKGNDAIMALLYFELANLDFYIGNKKFAEEHYLLAIEYGLKNDLVNNRIELLKDNSINYRNRIKANSAKEKYSKEMEPKSDFKLFGFSILILLTLGTIIYFKYTKK
jgi:hypothetical protein